MPPLLGLGFPTSPPIGQPLADNALHRLRHTCGVADAKCFTFIIAEVKFGKVALQVLLADMVKRAIDAAFEDQKYPSTVFVCQKPPPRTYSSIEWFTVPCPAKASPIGK